MSEACTAWREKTRALGGTVSEKSTGPGKIRQKEPFQRLLVKISFPSSTASRSPVSPPGSVGAERVTDARCA